MFGIGWCYRDSGSRCPLPLVKKEDKLAQTCQPNAVLTKPSFCYNSNSPPVLDIYFPRAILFLLPDT